MLDPVAIQGTIHEMQAQLTQLQRMMNDPNVPQQGRKNAQMQANDLTIRIQHAQFFLNMATAEANGGGVGPGAGGHPGRTSRRGSRPRPRARHGTSRSRSQLQ